jgi:hypothetical protein
MKIKNIGVIFYLAIVIRISVYTNNESDLIEEIEKSIGFILKQKKINGYSNSKKIISELRKNFDEEKLLSCCSNEIYKKASENVLKKIEKKELKRLENDPESLKWRKEFFKKHKPVLYYLFYCDSRKAE